MEDLTEDPKKRFREHDFLHQAIGSTLSTWNHMEEYIYLFFQKLVGVSNDDICSVLFFGVPSFSGRCDLVTRVAHFALAGDQYKEQRDEWASLCRWLKDDLSVKRNAVAHYSFDYNLTIISTNPPQFRMGEPRLSPSQHNQVLRGIKKKTEEKDAVTISKMAGYIHEFQSAEARIIDLIKSFPRDPAPKTGGFLAKLLLDAGSQPKSPLNQKPSGPDAKPSDPEPRS